MEITVVKVEGNLAIESRMFRLTRADAAGVYSVLKQQYQNKLNLVTFDPKTNSVIIQGTAEQVKQCAAIIKDLDQPVKEEARPPQSIGLQPIYASPLANKVTGARLTVTVDNDFQLNKVLAAAKKLNQDKPRVELEYDFSKHQLSIRALVDDLKISELSKVLEAGSSSGEN